MRKIFYILFLFNCLLGFSQFTGVNNTFQFPGAVQYNRVATAINRTVLGSDYLIECTMTTVGGTTTITLPDPTLNTNRSIVVKHKSAEVTMLVTVVVTGGGALIDDETSVNLYRYKNCTFYSDGTQWRVVGLRPNIRNVEVHPRNGFRTINEAVKFMRYHMISASSITVSSSQYSVTDSCHINLPYYLTINGTGFSSVSLNAAAGLTNKPMFVLFSGCKFKSMTINATTLANYGNNTGENCFNIVKSGQYFEFDDTEINGFNIGISDTTNSQIWHFNSVVNTCKVSGVYINTASKNKIFRSMAVDYFNNIKNIVLLKSGTGTSINIESCQFKNTNATDTCIAYRGGNFLFSSIAIRNNWWNITGIFEGGFDFTLVSGRDANVVLLGNVGREDKSPHCKINASAGVTATTIGTANRFYRGLFTNTSSYTCKWTITNGRMAYQPTNKKDVTMEVSIAMSVNQNNRTLQFGICKNRDSTVVYGLMATRASTSGVVYNVSTPVYISDIAQGDVFDIFVTSSNNADQITIVDVSWKAEAR